MSTVVIRGSLSTQASAICESDWPRRMSQFVEPAHFVDAFLRHLIGLEKAVRLGGPRIVGDAVQDSDRSAALAPVAKMECSRRRARPAHRAGRLRPSARTSNTSADGSGRACRGAARMSQASPRLLGRVVRDAGVERLALSNRRVERAHRFFERCVGIRSVGIEDVDVFEPHPLAGFDPSSKANTSASPIRRTARATSDSRPWSR